MSATTDDDLETMPEAQLLVMPEEASASGGLTAFLTRRCGDPPERADELPFKGSLSNSSETPRRATYLPEFRISFTS